MKHLSLRGLRWPALFLGLAGASLLALAPAGHSADAKKTPALPAEAGFKVGTVAPETSGVDVNGQRFKLSDYRGKVVVVDFWGDW